MDGRLGGEPRTTFTWPWEGPVVMTPANLVLPSAPKTLTALIAMALMTLRPSVATSSTAIAVERSTANGSTQMGRV